jgi:NitT/TauT family transport system ATP-binding protein
VTAGAIAQPEASNDAAAVSARGAAVEVRDVALTFSTPAGPRPALNAVSLAVAPGEVVSLIGPNGSGKSTLLRVIGGLLPPDRGSVLLDGRPIRGPDPEIGIVFQDPRLLPWRSVATNVTYPLELAGWSTERRAVRLAEVLALVDLEGAETARPSQLSGGMRQRAALARALVLEPRLLLLDEPFSALDALSRERFNLELLDLWSRTHASIVVVTHSIPEAIFLGDRVVVLSSGPGRVVADIPVDLPRPRRIEALDDASVSPLARTIRQHLAES